MERQLVHQEHDQEFLSSEVLPSTDVGSVRRDNSGEQPPTNTARLHCVAEPQDTVSQSFE